VTAADEAPAAIEDAALPESVNNDAGNQLAGFSFLGHDQDRIAIDMPPSRDASPGDNETGLSGGWKTGDGLGASSPSGTGSDRSVDDTASHANLSDTAQPAFNSNLYKGMILGSNANGDDFSYDVADGGGPAHGEVVFSNNTYTYTPASGHITEDDSFTITITDASAHTIASTITLHPV
jgi:hypothetical protein